MRPDRLQSKVFFYTTSQMTCPYLDNRQERRIVTELSGGGADSLHSALSKSGFRRSHNMAYAPVCPGCSQCIPVRIVGADFNFSKHWRRLERKFDHLSARLRAPVATQEQYLLFESYQKTRHNDGDMASMDYFDYRSMIEETPVRTSVVEFRDANKLVGALLLDHLDDGVSAVYSYFDPSSAFNGMGNYMVLWSIRYIQRENLPYVYLGYFIKDSGKMSYKSRFHPLEGCVNGLWSHIDT